MSEGDDGLERVLGKKPAPDARSGYWDAQPRFLVRTQTSHR
jgi:hypothetical protein